VGSISIDQIGYPGLLLFHAGADAGRPAVEQTSSLSFRTAGPTRAASPGTQGAARCSRGTPPICLSRLPVPAWRGSIHATFLFPAWQLGLPLRGSGVVIGPARTARGMGDALASSVWSKKFGSMTSGRCGVWFVLPSWRPPANKDSAHHGVTWTVRLPWRPAHYCLSRSCWPLFVPVYPVINMEARASSFHFPCETRVCELVKNLAWPCFDERDSSAVLKYVSLDVQSSGNSHPQLQIHPRTTCNTTHATTMLFRIVRLFLSLMLGSLLVLNAWCRRLTAERPRNPSAPF
jgi:hypothetical protein